MSSQPLSADALQAAVRARVTQNEMLSMRDAEPITNMYAHFYGMVSDALAGTNGRPSAAFWALIIPRMMVSAKKIKGMPGPAKKAMVLETLYIIVHHHVPADYRDAVLLALDTFASPAIDLAVEFYHGIKPKFRMCCRSKRSLAPAPAPEPEPAEPPQLELATAEL